MRTIRNVLAQSSVPQSLPLVRLDLDSRFGIGTMRVLDGNNLVRSLLAGKNPLAMLVAVLAAHIQYDALLATLVGVRAAGVGELKWWVSSKFEEDFSLSAFVNIDIAVLAARNTNRWHAKNLFGDVGRSTACGSRVLQARDDESAWLLCKTAKGIATGDRGFVSNTFKCIEDLEWRNTRQSKVESVADAIISLRLKWCDCWCVVNRYLYTRRGAVKTASAAARIADPTKRYRRFAQMQTGVRNPDVMGVGPNVVVMSLLWLVGAVVLNLNFQLKRRLAHEFDRNDLLAFRLDGTKAICLARCRKGCRWSGVDLLLHTQRGKVLSIVLVVGISQLGKFVFIQSRLRGVHS